MAYIIPDIQNTKVVYADKTTDRFDYVILCAGAFGTEKILTRNELAKKNENIGDHIIFMAKSISDISDPNLEVTHRCKEVHKQSLSIKR